MLNQRSQSQRIFGLDVCLHWRSFRSVAFHRSLSAHWPPDRSKSFVDGVDLFFVLSGSLWWHFAPLARTECRAVYKRCSILATTLVRPSNYYLFLLVNMGWIFASRGECSFESWAYFLFLQNFPFS